MIYKNNINFCTNIRVPITHKLLKFILCSCAPFSWFKTCDTNFNLEVNKKVLFKPQNTIVFEGIEFKHNKELGLNKQMLSIV